LKSAAIYYIDDSGGLIKRLLEADTEKFLDERVPTRKYCQLQPSKTAYIRT